MRNLVFNLRILDIKKKLCEFQTQNNLQIIVIFTNFVRIRTSYVHKKKNIVN